MKNILMILLLLTICLTGTAYATDQVFFYLTDPAGTPLAMTDASGQVVWKADYKPFGEENSVTGTTTNDREFVGKEKDNETGLFYFGARYESPKTGRFIAPESVRAVDEKTSGTDEKLLLDPQRINSYAYALNNPYRNMDPDGKNPILVPIVIAILANLSFSSPVNAPENIYTPTVPAQTAIQFAGEVALSETSGRMTGAVLGLVSREIAPFTRSLGAAAAAENKVLQSGGHTLNSGTLKGLGLTKEQGKIAMEALKKDILAPPNFHETKIWSNGDVYHSHTGQYLGNLKDYLY